MDLWRCRYARDHVPQDAHPDPLPQEAAHLLVRDQRVRQYRQDHVHPSSGYENVGQSGSGVRVGARSAGDVVEVMNRVMDEVPRERLDRELRAVTAGPGQVRCH